MPDRRCLCCYNQSNMDATLHEEKVFEHQDFSEVDLTSQEYFKCVFDNCNFSRCNLKNSDFIDCTFTSCNFSLALLPGTGLKNVSFSNCKLMGINFSACNNFLFSVTFTDCNLDYSSFFQKKMKKTIFKGCSLKEADFEETDLTHAVFNICDLLHATFNRTILEKTDFRTATNYSFDPELNRIKKAKFSYLGIPGLLAKYDIDIELE